MVSEAIRIELWVADPEDWKGYEDRLARRFQEFDGSSEPARFESLKLPGRRHEFLVARLLLANALTEFGADPKAVARDGQGKPIFGPTGSVANIHFNLSYSEGLVVCAATENSGGGVLGVDVESIGRRLDMKAVVERYFSPEERATFFDAKDDAKREVFFGCWTLKEAFLKGLGTGLRTSVLSCVFDLSRPGHIGFKLVGDPVDDARAWNLTLLAEGDHRIAVACRVGVDAQMQFVRRRVSPGGIEAGVLLRTQRQSGGRVRDIS